MRNAYTIDSCQFLDPSMLQNRDATQFAIEKGVQDDVIVVKVEDEELPNTVKTL